jgi:hypothetical protein
VFFEPPAPLLPEEPKRERRSQPPWLEKPRGVMLGSVPLELVLAREPKLAVVLCRLGACADGFDAELIVLGAEELEEEINGGMFGSPAPWRRGGERTNPELTLRFGVQYADGSKAELGERMRAHGERRQGRDQPPDGPLIQRGGGQGGDGEWRQRLWFWPLPAPGGITFALEWRAQGIELRLHELDAAPIREAAGRAQTLMPARELPDTPHYTSHTMREQDGS